MTSIKGYETESTGTSKKRYYNPNKKIKRFRGLEKLIYIGFIAGLGLTVGGKIKKSVEYQGIGGGLIVASFIGNNYLENKRNLEFKEYIKKKKNN